MSYTTPSDQATLTRVSLFAAVAVPVLYFGTQLAAAPFYPGYSFLSNSASLLGSDRSTLPAVLNVGAFITGIAALSATFGLFRSLPTVGARPVWVWLVALSVVSMGISSIWASVFHLPDPRHNPGALGAGTFLGPIVLLLALWPAQRCRGLKVYLLVNLVAFLLLVPVMAGFAGVDRSRYGGLLQRCAATVVYVPVGVAGYFLLRRTRTRDNVISSNAATEPARAADGAPRRR